MYTVTKDIISNINKLISPQNTAPNNINDKVIKSIFKLSILLKKNVDCKVWSIKQRKHKTITPVIKPLL